MTFDKKTWQRNYMRRYRECKRKQYNEYQRNLMRVRARARAEAYWRERYEKETEGNGAREAAPAAS